MGLFTTASEEQKQKEWELLNVQHVTSSELNHYRFSLGQTPLQSVQKLAIPTPHPQHKDYSSIETAKRKMSEDTDKVIRLPGSSVSSLHRFERPDSYEPFECFKPNISNFQKPLRLKMPKW